LKLNDHAPPFNCAFIFYLRRYTEVGQLHGAALRAEEKKPGMVGQRRFTPI